MFNRLAIAAATFGMVIVSGCTSPLSQDALARPNANRAQPASGSSGDLLYVAPNFLDGPRKNTTPGDVAYYTYPAGELVGTLNAKARGLCTDAGGNVFVVNDGAIYEFAHGGTTPINTLGNRRYSYWSCSVDPTTGNLAATFEEYSADPTTGSSAVTSESGGTGVAIFKNATGNQTTYTDAAFEHLFYCGYDGSGNLFADGFKSGSPSAFAELAAGSSKFETIQLNHQIETAGQVQWDGAYITIADERTNKIYRVEINGSAAIVVGKTKLDRISNLFWGSWIYEGTVIAPFAKKGVGYVGFWNYPRGGSPTKILPGPGYDTTDNAVTISPGS
jgi:hypothetical protein